MSESTFLLLTESEARAQVREMIESREWWVIPWLTEAAGDVSLAVEKAHYMGEANADFIAMMLPLPISFAHKRRMSAAAFGTLMAGLHAQQDVSAEAWAERLKTQDVVIAFTPDFSEADANALAMSFHDWVMA